jgi:ABC-2 type transport system ATP-binding protein
MRDIAIRTEDLSKTFGSTEALAELNLDVPVGEVLGYLGPNGAGKTTTIRLLLGLVNATRGRAEIFGVDCQADPVQTHRRVAYVPGEASLWPSLTGAETLHLLGRVQGRVDTAYRDTLVERFDLDPSKKVRAYSKGNRQKLILIAGLMTRADLLLLDEPTAGLDPLMERTFRACIGEARERGQTVFCPRTSWPRSRRSATGSRSCAPVASPRSEPWSSCVTCRRCRWKPSSTARFPTCPGSRV